MEEREKIYPDVSSTPKGRVLFWVRLGMGGPTEPWGSTNNWLHIAGPPGA